LASGSLSAVPDLAWPADRHGRAGQYRQSRGAPTGSFDVPIAYHARSRQPGNELDYFPTIAGLAEASDVLIVIVPGGAATKHLIGREVLAALGSDGVLINVSRGSVVDERALIEALQSGTILAAGLDVYEEEPRIPRELMDLPQVVLLPHIGSASANTRAAMGRLVVENLRNWFERGRPISPVPETRHSIARVPGPA
jgi:lactate dehydrogenase-like 2-hydroxyacid dehydrogenase